MPDYFRFSVRCRSPLLVRHSLRGVNSIGSSKRAPDLVRSSGFCSFSLRLAKCSLSPVRSFCSAYCGKEPQPLSVARVQNLESEAALEVSSKIEILEFLAKENATAYSPKMFENALRGVA
ncbi:hypothetical protein ABIB68_007138 [Bradyrhizobium sp. F1.2.2]